MGDIVTIANCLPLCRIVVMTKRLIKVVENFLLCRPQKRSLLLGLSGGPDSLALLYALVNLQEQYNLKLYLAHIDHGWREESGSEAEELTKLAKKLNLPLFVKKIPSSAWEDGNMELIARNERLSFFNSLYQQYKCDALLLAHHADDRSETVLKRVLEGASWQGLSSLKEETIIDDMVVWRPLLTLPKKTILAWLEKEKLSSFHDYTNYDPKYLRARMRVNIIPQLTQSFGKQVSSNLCRLGEDAEELCSYLDRRIEKYLSLIQPGSFGTIMNLQEKCPKEFVELKHLVRSFFGGGVSRSIIDTIASLLEKGVANRSIVVGDKHCFIDRRCLFCLDKPLEICDDDMVPLGDEAIFWGGWKITTQKLEHHEKRSLTSWRDVWQGKVSIVLPAGNYCIGRANRQDNYPWNSSIDRWWMTNKVPAFLRDVVPVVWLDGKINHEFLTGRIIKRTYKAPWIKILLCRE